MSRGKSHIHILLLLPLTLLFLADSATALSREIKAASANNHSAKTLAAPSAGSPGVAKKQPANGKEKLAVLDLDRSGVEADLAFSMSVVLRDELFALGEYEVLSREDLLALAKRLSLQQQAGDECADDQCLVSYGRSLGTRYMVAGVLSKVGNTYSVSLRLLDTDDETAGVMNRVYERCKCSEDELFDTVSAAATKLMRKQISAVAAVAAPPTSPEPPRPPGVVAPARAAVPIMPLQPGALYATPPPPPAAAALATLLVIPVKPAALPAPPPPPALTVAAPLALLALPGHPRVPPAQVNTVPAVATVAARAPDGNFADSFTGMEFVPVPGGCFQMGDTFGAGKSDELPVHEVCVDPFAIGKYEVTQGQWQRVMGKNPSRFQKSDNHPVENVSWEDTQVFISKLNQKSGRNYRLPTEAEWEFAARSGGQKEKYAGSDDVEAVAWYERNSGFSTRPVGGKSANGLGIYDMSGNVWEWCLDWRDSGYYATSPRSNPPGPATGPYHISRGGSWDDTPSRVRTSSRFSGALVNPRGGNVPGNYYFYQFFGLRLVLPPTK